MTQRDGGTMIYVEFSQSSEEVLKGITEALNQLEELKRELQELKESLHKVERPSLMGRVRKMLAV